MLTLLFMLRSLFLKSRRGKVTFTLRTEMRQIQTDRIDKSASARIRVCSSVF